MKAVNISFLLFCFLVPTALAQLRFGFYSRSCPRAETIIRNAVANRFRRDPSIAAALLRMAFHDCFVRGCDASLLIDPRPGRPSEKNAGPNSSVRGFELIDQIKSELETRCPNRVSCADIVVLATRDAVALAGGPGYSLPTGRRDGLVSSPNEVNLPGPSISVAGSLAAFQAKGMTLNDMVVLIGGGHSVGKAHCSLFQDRLNDPAMDRTLNARLRNTCRSTSDPSAFLDQRTPFTVDNGFYNEVLRQRGILRIDQNLALDGSTRGTCARFASSNALFRLRFAQAMAKMSNVGALTGRAGEIRRNCRRFNRG